MVRKYTVLTLVCGFLAAMWASTDLCAQPKPDPKDPKAPAGPRDPNDPNDRMDFGKVPLKLKGNTFSFHLKDVEGKEAASTDQWGRVTLVYVVPILSSGPYLDELKLLKPVFEQRSNETTLIGILVVTAERDGSHLKKAKEFIRQHQLPGERILLTTRQIADQVEDATVSMPWFVFLGRDGKVQSSTWSWTRQMVKKAEAELMRLLAEKRPEGKAPAAPPLEEVKAAEVIKPPEQHNPPDSG